MNFEVYLHRLFSFLVAASLNISLQASAWMEIPDSRSPDGMYALFYEHADKASNERASMLCFLGPGRSPASTPLVPNLAGKIIGEPTGWKTMDDSDSQILLNAVASHADALHSGAQVDPAFSVTELWSTDSRWISIEGGAHKFWHMEVWHLIHGQFEQVNLSQESKLISDYYDSHKDNLAVRQLGMERKIKGIRHRNYDWAYVGWFGNGIFAVDGYPLLLNEPQFASQREKSGEIYFLVDCRRIDEPKVIGACH